MLPAIYFIFSRKGCDAAVEQCIRDGLRLTNPDERRAIREYAELRATDLPQDELDVLGYEEWLDSLMRGIAAHHAGMIPAFKETVEETFARGLVKVVFATETLALGINMPARSVVIESLVKFTGERHEQMTPGEYTQLSGRAGRRGIDELGHSVVLLQRYVRFDGVTRLASTRTYPLESSFRPSYNMSVNLVRNYDLEEAEHLVNSSFAQFQADREVVRLERLKEQNDAYLASYRERMRCDRGDFDEYRQLVDSLREVEGGGDREGRTRATQVLDAIRGLKPGDVIRVHGGKKRGRYAVLEISQTRSERRPRVLAISDRRSMARFAPADFKDPPMSVGHVSLPRGFDVRNARARKEVVRRLSEVRDRERAPRERASSLGESAEAVSLRQQIEAHPCHGCPERKRHLHFSERAARLEREIAGLDRRIKRRTGTLARRFEQVLGVLETLGYVEEWALTAKGETLTRVYNESDLLVVEALNRHLFDDLDAAELTAISSTLVFEARGPEPVVSREMPTRATARVWRDLTRLWRQIRREEDVRGLELTREPDPGFADKAFLWAKGAPLEEVLDEDDAPGDFVRSMKQLIDLLRQMLEVAPTERLAATVTQALEGLQRGVVAYTSLDV
jgi:ATP-dependent RNA helicase HelY